MTTTTIADDDTERLARILRQGPLRQWPIEEVMSGKLMRFAQAYLMMASAGYRPAATDGSDDNRQRLCVEAAKYAVAFDRDDEDDAGFDIGCSNYDTNRAFALCIEAARLLSAGDADEYAARLLKLAIKEIAEAQR